MGGDFNVSPEFFTAEVQLWLEGARGQVVSNREGLGTCHFAVGAPPSELDFFIVSLDLVHRVEKCRIIDAPAFQPHRAVALTLKQGGEEPWERRLIAPEAFPTERPIGPAQETQPVDVTAQALCEMAESQDELGQARW